MYPSIINSRPQHSTKEISCGFLFFLLFLIAKPFNSLNFWQVTTLSLCETFVRSMIVFFNTIRSISIYVWQMNLRMVVFTSSRCQWATNCRCVNQIGTGPHNYWSCMNMKEVPKAKSTKQAQNHQRWAELEFKTFSMGILMWIELEKLKLRWNKSGFKK